MSRLPAVSGPVRRPMPDVYTVLLLVGILFLAAAAILTTTSLITDHQVGYAELFSKVELLTK